MLIESAIMLAAIIISFGLLGAVMVRLAQEDTAALAKLKPRTATLKPVPRATGPISSASDCKTHVHAFKKASHGEAL